MEKNLSKYYHLKSFKLIVSVILTILAMLLSQVGIIQDFENKALDYRFRHWENQLTPDSSMVIISIDDNSLDFFATNGVAWPWPRSFYGHLVDYLAGEGAQAIVFDMLFTHPDADRSDTDAEETDGLFAEALVSSGNTVLGLILEYQDLKTYSDSKKINIKAEPILHYPLSDSLLQLPIEVFLLAKPMLGHTNITPDQDGIFRHVTPIIDHRGIAIPSLALATYLSIHSLSDIYAEDGNLSVGDLLIPIQADGQQMINWYGPAGPTGVFPYYSFQAAIQSASAQTYGGDPSIQPGTFKDKIVVIGADASGLRDLKATPILQNGLHPGMEVWATVLSNYLQHDFIYPVHVIPMILILIGMSFVILYSFDRLKPRYAFIILLAQFMIYVLIAYFFWMISHRVLIPIAPVILISSLAYLLVFSNEMRERLFLKRVFGAYVSPELMQLMHQTRETPALGGEQVNGSAFFSDLQGFTKFSEKLSPVKLVALLNEYLTDMTDSLMELRGTLDKYEGDAIIAFFGAPVADDEHALQAVRSAIAMQKGLADLRSKWATEGDQWPDEIKDLQMRIGINSGEMLVGNVGSKGRMNFTMMGDTVNVAARLESSAKQYGVLTHISEATALQMPPEIILRRLGATQLVGKASAAVSYEVIGYDEDLTANDRELLKLWPQALEAVENQAWESAIGFFQKTLALERDYKDRPTNPSQVYLDIRIPGWRIQKPDGDWKPIWVFDSK